VTERILIVEDDASILIGLRLNLESEGYGVTEVRDGARALEAFRSERPDLVILDVMLPGMNGLEILSALRRDDPQIPVLMLSARDEQEAKILGLGLGADDYVTKPFDIAELIARINAALRRRRLKLGPQANQIAFGSVLIDLVARTVTKNGETLELTSREFDLLALLARARERVLSRSQILDGVWGGDYEGTERTVDNFIARLRTKIEDDPDAPRHIQTVRGVGYRFMP